MKLTFVCFDLVGKTKCLRCKRTIRGEHIRGIWLPAEPLEAIGKDRGYVYALCPECFVEMMDRQTGKTKSVYYRFFEDEIKAILILGKNPRIKSEQLFGRDGALTKRLLGR